MLKVPHRIIFAEYSILRNNSHGLIIQNYSICSQILQGKMKTLLIFGIQRMEMRGKEHYLTLCKRACLYRAVNWTVKNHCAFALQI